MTSKRISLQFPLEGLSDNNALSDQRPLTTRDARNVRGIDPVTGRTRGAQRSGMSKFCTTDLGTMMVQDIAVVTRDAPRIDYANLATGNLTVEWSNVTPQEGTTWWPEADFQGNVVLLDGDNQLAKYNADGVLLRKVALLSGDGGTVVRKVGIDVDGGIYAASYASDYTSGTIWRFVDSEQDPAALEESWRVDFSGEAPVMFEQSGNTLYVVVRPATGLVGYYLRRYDGPVTGVPTLGTSVECPGPVNALEFGASGALWLTSEADPNRGAGPDTNGITRVSRGSDLWTPHDLTNADERLYFWTRADNIDGEANGTLTDGDEVEDWEDNRFADATAATVYDTTDRKWSKDSGSPARPAPTYKATTWGGQYPCIQYDGQDTSAGANTLAGQALVTASNISANKKNGSTAALADQKAMMPGMDDSEWFTCLLVKITPTDSDDGPAALWSQWAEGTGGPSPHALSVGVLANAEWDSGSIVHSTDSVAMECETNSAAAGMTGGNADGATDQAKEGAFDANGYALITIVHHGISASSSSFRVNGRWTDSFVFSGDMNYGSGGGGKTILGCRRAAQSQNTQTDYWRDGDGWVSFTGEVVECITVLSDSSAGTNTTDTHDLRISHPHGNGTPYGFSASSEGALVGQRTARHAVLASEVELVEGYMAHYWGVSHTLPREYKDAPQTGNYPANHPFAGTGNYPRKSGSTIDPLIVDQWSPDALLWRMAPASLSVTQAIAGGGIGYALATDESGDCAVVGPKSGRTGSGTHYGPDNLADETVIARKIEDRLDGIKQDAASWGAIYCKSPFNFVSSGGGVLDGDKVVVSDGTTSVTFEFDDDATFTDTQVDISSLTLASLQLAELVTEINASALDITARQNGPLVVELFHDSTGANNSSINVTVGGARIGAIGMRDGSSATTAWTVSDASNAPDQAGLRLAFDDEGDLWVPRLLDDEPEDVVKLDGTDGSTLVTYSLDSSQEATGVALPLSRPSYIGSPSVTGPLFMWVTSTGGALDPQEDNFRKVRLVSETQDLTGGETPRATRYLAVVDGDVKEFENGAATSTKAGGSLESSSPYIQSAVLANKVVWCDGTQYLVYDAQEDTLGPLVATKGGSAPRNGRLVANWNDRLLIARTDDDPHNIFGSRRGDITDWDEFPPVPDYLEAFSLSNSQAGKCPDIVNSLMPLNDDLLYVGGDHSLFRLTGDPTMGGSWDLVSDITGIAYGTPWTKDPSGAAYFFGSRGGVYRVAPGGIPQRLTRDRIERRMADLDLSTHRVRMAYNYRDEGLHVFAVPYAQKHIGNTAPVGWFLDKNGAWWEDDFATTDVAPTAVAVADGDDPDDRVLLIGGGDGYVRKWDGAALSDDGERIASHVLIGPIAPVHAGREFRFMHPQITLASDQQGAWVEFFATDDPQDLGAPIATAQLGPGMNPRLPMRARGTYLYAKVYNAAVSERWAYEKGEVSVAPAGRQRVR